MTPEQSEERESLITAVFVFVAILTASLTFCRADESAAYWRAKAATAIAIEGGKSPAKTGGTDAAPSPPKETKADRPVVYQFFAPFNCPPCNQQKADVEHWKPEHFDLKVGDKCPVPLDGYPLTCWKVGNVWWSFSGWHGRKHLENEWKRTQSARSPTSQASSAATTTLTKTSSLATRQHWTSPTEIRHHLQTVHNLPEARYLTTEQAKRAHDYLHSGGTVEQLRSMFSR